MRLKKLLFLLIPAVFAACSPYNRVLKGSDMDAKMEYAVKLYNKGDYFKALPLLEELITSTRTTSFIGILSLVIFASPIEAK